MKSLLLASMLLLITATAYTQTYHKSSIKGEYIQSTYQHRTQGYFIDSTQRPSSSPTYTLNGARVTNTIYILRNKPYVVYKEDTTYFILYQPSPKLYFRQYINILKE